MATNRQQPIKTTDVSINKQRSYNEIIEFLDGNWKTNPHDTSLTIVKKLDQALGSPSKKINTIFVTGTNGKSLTINFAAQLLRQEGLSVGMFYSPHILTYNERLAIDNEIIANKTFADLANDVINAAETLNLTPNSFEILTLMSFLYFQSSKVDVALLEVDPTSSFLAPTMCTPKVVAITRINPDDQNKMEATLKTTLSIVAKDTHVVSADQSKLNLHTMQKLVQEKNGVWSMPIRKLATLSYPYEQLHGRCAALAERIAHIYVNTFVNANALVLADSLLTKQKGQRGRPTLEAKRQSELNPKKTVEQFWKEAQNTLSCRFQLLDKEKPTLLLDNANNLDAFNNVLLGIRLLCYQRPLKGLTLVIGCNNPDLNIDEFLKALRYFFKKTSGQVIVCPVAHIPGQRTDDSWDVEKITNSIKSMKIKAKSARNFKEAFEMARKTVDDRHGLVVMTGSSAIVTEYWRYKGIKKLTGSIV